MPILSFQTSSVFPPRSPAHLQLDRITGWEVYRRLQNLDIPCQYGVHQPLAVAAETPLAIAQVWGVVKAITTPKTELAEYLNRCWYSRTSP